MNDSHKEFAGVCLLQVIVKMEERLRYIFPLILSARGLSGKIGKAQLSNELLLRCPSDTADGVVLLA